MANPEPALVDVQDGTIYLILKGQKARYRAWGTGEPLPRYCTTVPLVGCEVLCQDSDRVAVVQKVLEGSGLALVGGSTWVAYIPLGDLAVRRDPDQNRVGSGGPWRPWALMEFRDGSF